MPRRDPDDEKWRPLGPELVPYDEDDDKWRPMQSDDDPLKDSDDGKWGPNRGEEW